MKDMLCDYRGRKYAVREDGSVYRFPKEDSRPTKLDGIWSFGKKNEKTGYMFIGGVGVHRIVATAYWGTPIDSTLVVDHIDTNRCNNRPENLRWVTRLENILENPITRKRIEQYCGSIQAYLDDPSILREIPGCPNTKWMRTVSKQEASKCFKNLSRWASEDEAKEKNLKRGELGDWIFADSTDYNGGFGESWDTDWQTRSYQSDYQKRKDELDELYLKQEEEQFDLKPSLTNGAYQLNWKIPAEFPMCPSEHGDEPLKKYQQSLHKGTVFCHTQYYESSVLKAEISEDGNTLVVMTMTSSDINGFALAEVTYIDGHFIHKNIRTFFTEEGVEKYFTLSIGKDWEGEDVLEDYC